MKEAGDHDLLRASRGDPEAFGQLAERHLPALRLWAYGQTRELATANDVAAETLARAWITRRRYRGECDATARGWLFGIARNVVREWRRAKRVEAVAMRRMRVQLPPPADDPAELDERLDAMRCDAAARGWLFGIARNVVREWRRRLRVEAVAVRRLGWSCRPETMTGQRSTSPWRRSSAASSYGR